MHGGFLRVLYHSRLSLVYNSVLYAWHGWRFEGTSNGEDWLSMYWALRRRNIFVLGVRMKSRREILQGIMLQYLDGNIGIGEGMGSLAL
jgi:hypothetical protein